MLRTPVLTLVLLLTPAAAWAQRLPAGVTPIHYDLLIAPDLARAKFTGEETILVRLDKPSPVIVLNAAEITFHEVHVSAAGKTQPARVTLDERKEQATLRVESSIPAGEVEIIITYEGVLNNDLRGLYLSEANNRRYAVSQLEATDARRMFPSFDEPAMKATFSLRAVIDQGDHAISNGAIVSDTPGPVSGKHTVKFEKTHTMSTYLVALAVGDFECNEGTADGIPVRVCSTPDKKHLTGFALQAARQQVEFYNGYFSIPYPFKKLDIVAVPDFAAGAMENTGAIFYRETLLLSDDSASVDVRRNIALVLAHEIAHQWFGNLVTMKWWDDLWLNEGLADWMMTKPVNAWRPDWNTELEELSGAHTAMAVDALRSTRPIRSAASTPAEINELFDPIAYQKGAAVIRMLEAWVGDEPFRQAINAYIEKFQSANARAEDFWDTLTGSAGKPIDRVMRTFVDQPGVPLVSLELDCAGAAPAATLAQERYFRDPAVKNRRETLWQIPVCLAGPGGATTCELLDAGQKTIPLETCPAWKLANAGARGYYRSALDPGVLTEMADETGKLSESERMALLSDEWALARAGRHDVGVVLDLAAGFAAERTPEVVGTLASVLAGVGETLTVTGTRVPYRAWVARLIWPALTEVGTTARPNDTDSTKTLRATLFTILGRTARDGRALAMARELVSGELAKPGSVDSTLLSSLVELAAIQGDVGLYDGYVARSKAAATPEERYLYLYGLTSFNQPALIERTFELALSPAVRSQDAKYVIARLLANPDARNLAWQLVQEQWAGVQARTGEFVANTVIVNALGSFCDARRADEVEKFFLVNKVPDAARTLQQSLEHIRSCARFAELQRPNLAEWVKAH
jgi:aminopeptidase N